MPSRSDEVAALRTTLFEEAKHRYAVGDLHGAFALLDARRDPLDDGAFFLFVQIMIRTGAADRARREIGHRLPDLVSSKNVVRGHLLAAAAALACDAVDDALASLDVVRNARGVAIEREEEALYRALAAHRRGRAGAFRDAIKVACASADPALNARAHRLAGNSALAEGDLPGAYAAYGRGFSALNAARPIDDRLLATLFGLVAFGEAELERFVPGATLEAIEKRSWHASVQPLIGIALHYTGTHLSRRGRYAEATAALLRAIAVSGESANALGALGRASANATDANEPLAAQGFYVAATGLADRIVWEHEHPDARDALLGMAMIAARRDDLSRASRYLARFAALAAGLATRPAGGHRTLLVAHASALIASMTPSARDAGIRNLRHIRREWSRLGFVWRAIDVRADLYAVTGQHFLLEANRSQRQELLRGNASAIPEATVAPAPVTPQQRKIVAAVARGSSTGEIAGELGISARTVKNQLHKIYANLAIENPSRGKLVAFVRDNPALRLSGESV